MLKNKLERPGRCSFYTAEIFKEAESAVDPNVSALAIGVTYFLSSILGLVLKNMLEEDFATGFGAGNGRFTACHGHLLLCPIQ